RPAAAKLVQRPEYARRSDPRLGLTHALVASDLNERYLGCWPLARRAWREYVGVDACLVLVAEPDDVPETLSAEPGVVVFPPAPGLHTAFQAQGIRLLYPGLLDTDGAVITADIDM